MQFRELSDCGDTDETCSTTNLLMKICEKTQGEKDKRANVYIKKMQTYIYREINVGM